MTDVADLIARLDALSIAWSLDRNNHRLYYEAVAENLDRLPADVGGYDESEIPPADRQAAIETDQLYEVKAWPTTPVGHLRVASHDLATALKRMVEALEAD